MWLGCNPKCQQTKEIKLSQDDFQDSLKYKRKKKPNSLKSNTCNDRVIDEIIINHLKN